MALPRDKQSNPKHLVPIPMDNTSRKAAPPVTAPVMLYNRQTGRVEQETIVGRRFMDLSAGTGPGRWLTMRLLILPMISRIYGWWQQHPASRRSIPAFIRQFEINMTEVQIPQTGFASFNDFFIRRLKPEARPISRDPGVLISPADGRIKCFPIEHDTRLAIKGSTLGLGQILSSAQAAAEFAGGMGLQVRLAPVDYHRFAYIDDGTQGPVQRIPGPLYSVSPVALRVWPRVWAENCRHWCRLETATFGPVIQVEIGAMLVGSIIQHRPEGGPCRRGAEKGYFALGGSTVLLFFTKGALAVAADIRHHSRQNTETLVKYGEVVGRAGDRTVSVHQ